tara:strand:+ start:155 stop:541 length:387 start_codon:yes stop_codon:yes gene_type:complete
MMVETVDLDQVLLMPVVVEVELVVWELLCVLQHKVLEEMVDQLFLTIFVVVQLIILVVAVVELTEEQPLLRLYQPHLEEVEQVMVVLGIMIIVQHLLKMQQVLLLTKVVAVVEEVLLVEMEEQVDQVK